MAEDLLEGRETATLFEPPTGKRRHDPPAVAVGLTPSEFESFVRLFCPKAAAEGLTIVARLAGTGELVGALLTEDCASALPDG